MPNSFTEKEAEPSLAEFATPYQSESEAVGHTMFQSKRESNAFE
jgi:hypothetical protein